MTASISIILFLIFPIFVGAELTPPSEGWDFRPGGNWEQRQESVSTLYGDLLRRRSQNIVGDTTNYDVELQRVQQELRDLMRLKAQNNRDTSNDPNTRAAAETALSSLDSVERMEAVAPTSSGDGYNCSLWSPSTWGACLVVVVQDLAENVIVWLGSVIVSGANHIFNLSFDYSVRGFADFINNTPSVRVAWGLVRDLVNLGLIFSLLYAALNVILGRGDGKRLVGWVIIGALLVNFSAFFAGLVINGSNILANQIYQTAATETVNGTPDLATRLIKYRGSAQTTVAPGRSWYESAGASIAFSFGQFGLSVATATVLLAGAALMIIRFVQLLLVLIFSPIFFVGLSLPAFKPYSEKIKNALFYQALFAPAFLFMILVTANFTSAIKLDTGSSFAEVVLATGLSIAFMIGAMVVANKFGVVGAKWGSEMVNKAVGRATFGFAGRLGRTTIGRAGAAIKDSDTLKNRAAQRGVTGWLARRTLVGADKVATSSFDVRATNKDLAKNYGKAQKGGFEGAVKTRAENLSKQVKLFTSEPSEENKNRADASKKISGQLEKDFKGKNADILKQEAEVARLEKDKENKLAEAAAAGLAIPKVDLDRLDAGIASAKDVLDKKREEVRAIKPLIEEQLAIQNEALATRQSRFEESLKDVNAPWYRFNTIPLIGKKPTRVRKAQAKKIRDEFGKSKGEKDRERLSKILEDSEKEKVEEPKESAEPTA